MSKRILAILCLAALLAALMPAVLAEGVVVDSRKGAAGMFLFVQDNGDAYSGANIILGSDASVWPFAAAGEDGAVALTPEKDATYKLTFNVKSTGTEGFRVRWVSEENNGSYTKGDAAVVNDHVKKATEVATVVPAYFQDTIKEGETKTFTVEVKMDGSAAADGLIGNLAIRGQGGGNDFIVNWITLEGPVTPGSSGGGGGGGGGNPKTGTETYIFIALGALALAAAGAVVFARKAKA